MNSKSLSVCVVGAGPSGIVTVKELKEQGHKVTCFERRPDPGGVFADMGSYDSLALTVSNYFMAFSDLMPTDERLRFWTRREYRNYLERYIEHFGLGGHFSYGTEIVGMTRAGQHWVVESRTADGAITTTLFDAVALCCGNFGTPRIPRIDGLDGFTGQVWHASQYRNAKPFEDKRVVCVGFGESSADVVSEISMAAKKTVLSLRRHPITAPKYIIFSNDKSYDPHSFTVDTLATSRFLNGLPDDLHEKFHQQLFKAFSNSRSPATRIMGEWNRKAGIERHQFVTKNERVFDHIADGQVEPNLSDIARIDGDRVIFGDGKEQVADAIMFCTGYVFDIPLLKGLIDTPRDLYKQVFHPTYGASLACIGYARPQQGGLPALSELQARYFALVCSGQRELPDAQAMPALIAQDRQRWETEFPLSPTMKGLVHYSYYAEELARLIGCEFKESFWKDPEFFAKCYFGPMWPIQYRLRGPGARTERAREIIATRVPLAEGEFKPVRLSVLAGTLMLRKLLPVGKTKRARVI